MRSLHKRLDPQKEAVLQVAATFGRWKAMRDFKVSDYLCFHKWLEEVTGDENYGLHPAISLNGGQTLGDQVVAAFLEAVLALKTENQKLHEEVEHLKWQLSAARDKEELQALAILQACRV